MLVVAYAGILASDPTSARLLAVRVIAAFGLVLTAMWSYSSHRQWQLIRILVQRAAETLPEFQVTIKHRGPVRRSGTAMIAYAAPIFPAIMWLILVILV